MNTSNVLLTFHNSKFPVQVIRDEDNLFVRAHLLLGDLYYLLCGDAPDRISESGMTAAAPREDYPMYAAGLRGRVLTLDPKIVYDASYAVLGHSYTARHTIEFGQARDILKGVIAALEARLLSTAPGAGSRRVQKDIYFLEYVARWFTLDDKGLAVLEGALWHAEEGDEIEHIGLGVARCIQSPTSSSNLFSLNDLYRTMHDCFLTQAYRDTVKPKFWIAIALHGQNTPNLPVKIEGRKGWWATRQMANEYARWMNPAKSSALSPLGS